MSTNHSRPSEETTPAGAEGSAELSDAREAAEGPDFYRLCPASRQVWILGGLLTALVVGACVGLVEYLWLAHAGSWPLPPPALAVGVFGVLVVHALVFSAWRYRAWRYAVRPHDVLLHYGVLWRMRRCIPRLRIQHVDIESGPIDRVFGMVKLSLYTAGTNAAVGTIPGLLPPDAEALRETLLETDHSDG